MSIKFKLYRMILEEGHPVEFMRRHYVGIRLDEDVLAEKLGCSLPSIYLATKKLVDGKIILRMTLDSWRHSRKILLARKDTAVEKLSENFKKSEVDEIIMIIKKGYNDYNASPKPLKDNELGKDPANTYEVSINHNVTSLHKDTSILNTTTQKDTSILNTSTTSKPDGYYASEYVSGGSRHGQTPRSKKSEFVRYFMRRIYSMHQIDYYIPKTRLGKYYTRAIAIMDMLGGIEEAKKFIDWYLSLDRLKASGYNLDLLISSPMLNQYQAGDPNETKKGLATTFVEEEERADFLKKGKII